MRRLLLAQAAVPFCEELARPIATLVRNLAAALPSLDVGL